MLLVGSHFHLSFACKDDACIFESVGKAIDEHFFHDTRFAVLALDVDVVSVYFCIEYALGDIELGRSLFHGYQECPELLLGFGGDDILKVERDAGQHGAEDNERGHDA